MDKTSVDKSAVNGLLHDPEVGQGMFRLAQRVADNWRGVFPRWSSGVFPRGNALGPPGAGASEIQARAGRDTQSVFGAVDGPYTERFLEYPGAEQLHYRRESLGPVLMEDYGELR